MKEKLVKLNKVVGIILMALLFALGTKLEVYGADVCIMDGVGYSTIQDAVNTAGNSGNIVITANIAESPGVSIPPGKDITIDLNGHSVKFASGIKITVGEGNETSESKLTIQDNCGGGTITTSGASAVSVQSTGNFTLSGGTITGSLTYDGSIGGGVNNNGTFTMTGGSILGCSAGYGGGVYNNGTFTMSGGSILGCSAGYGAGVHNFDKFTMTGGTISGCSADFMGGGVFTDVFGTFTMTGGKISGCSSSSYGGGVYDYGTFKMQGGTISKCTATVDGGGVYIVDNKTFKFEGSATVWGNTAMSEKNNVVQKDWSSGDDPTTIQIGDFSGLIGFSRQMDAGAGVNYSVGDVFAKMGTGGPYSGARNLIADLLSEDGEPLAGFAEDDGKIVWKVKTGSISKKSDPGEEIEERPDLDTYKSEAPSRTAMAVNVACASDFWDMKVHSVESVTDTNQRFLADYYAKSLGGTGANVILTKSIYPRRDLSITEKDQKRMLVWNDLPIKTAGNIYAVCYDKNHGAYLMTGTVDAKGTAAFVYYLPTEACNITIFTLK